MKEIIDSLSPLERKILPYIEGQLKEIEKKTGLDETSVLRGLKFLENKKIVNLAVKKKTIISLGVNGVYYRKNHLPERKLILFLEKNKNIILEKAQKESGLSDNEFKAALGALKRKALLSLAHGKMALSGSKEELSKKFPEEALLERLPKEKNALEPEESYTVDILKSRKNIIEFEEEKEINITATEFGKNVLKNLGESESELLEEITPELIKEGIKNKKFRRYDIHAPVPNINGGKTHFVNQARNYARRIWLDMGFEEMDGPIIESSFWVFDALFTAQDHSVREMVDSFYVKGYTAELPSKILVSAVKQAHENGVAGSTGWGQKWDESEAKKLVLRTHTTSLSARTLSALKKNELPKKYFAVGKAFRNETLDWSHGIEFFQTEGIVISEKNTLRHLLGYLKEFYKKMGFEKIRFRPSFFPYTEPSVEIDVYHKEKEKWLELGGAGILRPEVTMPLLGKVMPVLAWGQGLDRTIMDAYAIKDLREVYANNFSLLRKQKMWEK